MGTISVGISTICCNLEQQQQLQMRTSVHLLCHISSNGSSNIALSSWTGTHLAAWQMLRPGPIQTEAPFLKPKLIATWIYNPPTPDKTPNKGRATESKSPESPTLMKMTSGCSQNNPPRSKVKWQKREKKLAKGHSGKEEEVHDFSSVNKCYSTISFSNFEIKMICW